ncbi:hypothetical protein [Streptomyces fructofermentans]|uniref:Uncharacterized protein n=1 Tax=Streptomyces fructofermentans TaxID=152141 RepID=A0A918NW48_9ACTN|nr:hypothetical protein [Streptomyces fructofermentans]GGX99197.1 hypothetical protein GCM10010515_76730 [Streptomyces fructofermentans]
MALVIARIGRVLAIAVVVLGAPAAMAMLVTHLMLDDTAWTDPQPTSSVQPPAPTATAPAPARTKSVGPNELLGTCAVPTRTGAVPAPCGTRGALTVVGTTRRDSAGGREPCRTTPFTTAVRRYGDYWLCLGTP